MRKLVYHCKECDQRFVAYDGVPLLHTEWTGHIDIEVDKMAFVIERDVVIRYE